MQPDRKEQRQFPDEEADNSMEVTSRSQIQTVSYAQELRALGQAIEHHNFSSLNLELESGIYIVSGTIKAPKKSQRWFSSFIRDLIYCAVSPEARKAVGKLDLRYTPEEIQRLDLEGRTRREKSDRMPNPHSLSQILRSAGFYVDNSARLSLVGITVEYPWVSLRFQTGEGRLEQAKQHFQFFYECWVNMYLRRSNRPSLPSSNESSPILSWEEIKQRNPAS